MMPECDGLNSAVQLEGFVEAGGRLLHYVRMGTGPAVVLLHAAPCSAKVMAPLQRVLAPSFTSFAFDLPGFGLSEMLGVAQLETADLADAIAGGIRALGLTQVAAYGRHTGAGVAVELARRHPELCSMVLTDGFPVFAQPYSDERLAEYLQPIVPSWDGAHLTWAWFRYREQHVFWPWDRPMAAHRADCDVPGVDFLYRGTIELLEAGANYPAIYASAFRHAGLAMIGEVKPPVCFGNRPGDSQHKTMALYPTSAWVKEFPRDDLAAATMERSVLARHPAAGVVPPHVSGFRMGVSRTTGFISTRDGNSFAIGYGLDHEATPVLVLHDLPGSATLHRAQIEALGAERPAIAFDFMGQCNSRLVPGESINVRRWAGQVEHVMSTLQLERVHLYAHGTAAAVALEVAQTAPGHIASIVFQSPPVLDGAFGPNFADRYAPDIAPSADGANFLRLWHHLRDQELWFPWFEQNIAHAKNTPPRIAPADLHARALAMLKQPMHYRPTWQAVLSYPLEARMAALRLPRQLVYRDQDVFAPVRAHAAATLGLEVAVPLPPAEDEAARLLDRWLAE